MGLGEALFRLNIKPTPLRDQGGRQLQPDTAIKDFVAQYLRCLGISELGKLPEALRRLDINKEAVRCITELMRSRSWDELFTKLNLEVALLETAARHELQSLVNNGDNQGNPLLLLRGLYNIVATLNLIRWGVNNENTRQASLTTLVEATYLLFDIYGELVKRGIIPQDLEIEIWRIRETLIKIMEELFKGNGTITVHGKSFDANKQLR